MYKPEKPYCKVSDFKQPDLLLSTLFGVKELLFKKRHQNSKNFIVLIA